MFWLRDGDLNTRFFHQNASSRKARNHIRKIKNEAGAWVDNQAGICEVVGNYFRNLFDGSSSGSDLNFLEAVHQVISP